jgi:hypothetical protein
MLAVRTRSEEHIQVKQGERLWIRSRKNNVATRIKVII